MKFPIPAGLELPDVPEGETIVLPVTFSVDDGMLKPLDIDGFALEDSEEEMEMEAPENEDFVSSVNRQLQ